jgi:hypothetical protein
VPEPDRQFDEGEGVARASSSTRSRTAGARTGTRFVEQGSRCGGLDPLEPKVGQLSRQKAWRNRRVSRRPTPPARDRPAGERQGVDPDTGERERFSSAILPPWARKTAKITEVLPLLYLHGLSSGDFVPALGGVPWLVEGLVGAGDHEADRAVEGRAARVCERDLSTVDYVYLWADGIHVNIRLEEGKLCLL